MKSPYITLFLTCFIILFQHLPATCQNTILINEKVFGGNGIERNCMLIPISTGTYFVAGRSDSNISGNKNSNLCTPDTADVWLLKLDASLNMVWEKSIGGRFSETTVFSTASGSSTSLIIAVESESDSSCFKSQQGWSPVPGVFEDYWVVLVDSNGTITADMTWGGFETERNPKCYLLSDGNYIATGASKSGVGGDKSIAGFGGQDYWVIKFDSNGNKLWDQVYGGLFQEQSANPPLRLNFIVEGDSGQLFLFGSTSGGISGNITTNSIGGAYSNDWILWQLENNGNILNQRRYGGTGADKINDALRTNDGGLLMIGTTRSPVGYDVTHPSLGNWDCWVLKVDSLFNVQWDQRYGGSDEDECVCGEHADHEGYYIGGYTKSPSGFDVSEPPFSSQDYWIFKIDSLGNKIWDKRYGGSGGNTLYNFAVLPDTSIILSGTSGYGSSSVKSFPGYGLSDYWIVHMKYNGSLTSTNEPVLSQQLHLYPNPSNGTLQIPGFLRDASVTISDVTGRGIAEIPVPESTTLDLSYLPNGCYHFRFVTKSGNYYAKWIKM